MGIYRAVVVSARYQIPEGVDPVPAITSALTSVVRDQPMLRVGILDQDTSTAAFSHLPEIDLRNHLEWRHVEAATPDDYEAELATTQGWLHDQFWPDIETRAPWKILCLRPRAAEVATGDKFVDVFFSYHHALTDGSGGREFHQHLLAALQSQADSSAEDVAYMLSFPEAPKLPESQEDAIPFRNSYVFLLRTVWSMLGPSFLKSKKTPVWGGIKIDFSVPYRTRVKRIDFTAEEVRSFIEASREHNSTLTTAMHGVILSSLAKRVSADEAQSFVCNTPISLRPFMKPSVDPELKTKLRVMVTTHDSAFSQDLLAALRAPDADVDAIVWQTGKRIRGEMKERIATIPADDVAGLVPLISDHHDFWRKKDGTARAATWEISNVGVIPSRANADASTPGWRHTKTMFTNGAMVAGAVIGTNVISVEGGVLTVALSWQENAVSEELINGLALDLKDFVLKTHELRKSTK